MRFLKDIRKSKKKIMRSLRKHGCAPEHNYYHYLYKETPSEKCIFADFGQGRGIMALYSQNSNVWHVMADVLAPKEEQAGIFLDFVKSVSKKKAKKVVAEFREELKKEVFKALRKSKLKASRPYILHWPVFDMKDFDEKLSGKHWKKIRNIRNRFSRGSKIKAINARKVDKNVLRNIFMSWLKKRNVKDRVDLHYYLNLIDNGFKGFDFARSVSIDSEPCSISAGWEIPNSDDFYCGIGVFNYKHKDMGDLINLHDLMTIKKLGYSSADLGGSDLPNLFAKKKFRPKRIYKTYIFSVTRK